MAASPTPRPRPKTAAEADAFPGAAELQRWAARHSLDQDTTPIGIACSGGADSVALLLAAHARWPGRCVALHVHHGLQAAADGFEACVREVAASLGLPVHVARVDARHAPGQSPEDAARLARYAALAGLARDRGIGWVLLAQHGDDQAETVLLALSRGAGLPGLSAMPEAFERHGQRFGRPWLGVPAHTLREALIARDQRFVDDPSNGDERYTRNRIRAQLMPAWARAFPGYRAALARSAAHAAQAQRLLDELAALDLAATGEPPRIVALQGLSRDRQANTLRHWLRRAHGVAPSAAQLDELLDQVGACRTRGHAIRLKVAEGFVVRDGACLAYTP
ncbi:tRNA lysidine(34) synthetase TilS [Hydrogenophaga sp. YM1]|nr:tRNA lysidine(34) synthetase TilS [Hydrogenophaga sp. YM1]